MMDTTPLNSSESENPVVGTATLESVIHRSKTSTIYLARHVDLPVALKMLNTNMIQDAAPLRRFMQEARIASGYQHPNLAQPYNFGVHEDRPYMVMQLVEGSNLQKHLTDGRRFTLAEVCNIFEQVCNALEALHKTGVIHGDCKPSHMILRDKPEIDVVLVDLFCAQIFKPDKENPSAALESGGLLGTPYYMSPEQFLKKPLDPRADVYSLGCSLYQMLCGRTPFKAANLFEAFSQQVFEEPTRPRVIRADLPEAWECIVLQAMEKDRDLRFKNIEQMKNAILEAGGKTPKKDGFLSGFIERLMQ